MFQLLIKWQIPVMMIAGISTALLFGLGDISSSFTGQTAESGPVSPEMRQDIVNKLKLQRIMNNRDIPGDQWDAMIAMYAKNLNDAKRDGIAVSDEEVRKFILTQFKTKEQYMQVLKALENVGASPSLVEAYFRDQILFQKQGMMPMLAAYVTKAEIEAEYHRRNDTLKYDVVKVDTTKVVVDDTITDEQITEYYQEHGATAQEFQEPEKVKLNYLFINKEKVSITDLSEENLRQYYNLNRDKYPSSEFPEEAEPYFDVKERVEKNYIDSQRTKTAERILNKIDDVVLNQESTDINAAYEEAKKSDASFSVVEVGQTDFFSSREYSIEPFGFVYDITRSVFGDDAKDYDAVKEGSNGFYSYQVAERKAQRTKTQDESIELIKEKILDQRREAKAKELADTWKIKLAETKDWSGLDLTKETAVSFYQDEVQGAEDTLAAEALKKGLNIITDVVEFNTAYHIVRLTDKIAASANNQKALDEIKQTLQQSKARDIQIAIYTSK